MDFKVSTVENLKKKHISQTTFLRVKNYAKNTPLQTKEKSQNNKKANKQNRNQKYAMRQEFVNN